MARSRWSVAVARQSPGNQNRLGRGVFFQGARSLTRSLIRLMTSDADDRVRYHRTKSTPPETSPKTAMMTKTVNVRSDAILVVRSAIRNEIPTDTKKIAKFKYTEFGEPFSRSSS